ncbi:hypothetical protein PsorP6_001761 [Peronosclerospora sorghi]|uniref:Uncharacterized protein n=1 Tax=Peronosclerospora sorghi TaxID=230839 RepID=A0ACC0WVX0_9STRA|nr:hypothetical protein PsorP6_001761 [Peronosclerospora sorghi]
MSLPSSRLPLGSRKPSFRASPSASARLSTSKMTPPTPSRRASIQAPSPLKRLQFTRTTERDGEPKEPPPPPPARLARSLSCLAATSLRASSPIPESDTIRVFVRIRPSSCPESSKCLVVAPDARGVTLAPASQHAKRFTFDRVFADSCDQADLFDVTGRVAVDDAINGYNGSIFAYGQTGSGKTFTMLGNATDNIETLRQSPDRGLTPRILDYLFTRLETLSTETTSSLSASSLHYTLSCSYLEIYNEKIYDLLEPRGSTRAHQPKHLREDSTKRVYVDQLRHVDVTTAHDALSLLAQGAAARHVSSTDMNRASSRSHAVFSVHVVVAEPRADGRERTRRSCLHLVDLAGSEKQRQTHVQGQRLKEAAQINKSLSALGNVMMALVDVSHGQTRHVHYRDSKLTFLLREALGGNARTSLVATVAPDEKYFTETLSTLKFAQRAKLIQTQAVQNEDDAETRVPQLQLRIETLERALAACQGAQGAPAEPAPAKPNRWEPALEVMEKLLQASGALASRDTDDARAVERRCDRLEMLLYRMICRFEEYKDVTYDPDRFEGGRGRLSGHGRRARVSMLPTPKRYDSVKRQEGDEGMDPRVKELEHQVREHARELDTTARRVREVEAENELMRQELCGLLEWKALVEDERRRGSESSPIDGLSAAWGGRQGELETVVEAYRWFFDEVMDVVARTTPPVVGPLRSPTSSSSVFTDTNSTSYASGEESDERDEWSSVDGVDGTEDGGNSEVRRVKALGGRLRRHLDVYQDTMQRLEKELQATHEELETASAATKFAEFQLQQLRRLDEGKSGRPVDESGRLQVV